MSAPVSACIACHAREHPETTSEQVAVAVLLLCCRGERDKAVAQLCPLHTSILGDSIVACARAMAAQAPS